MENGSLYRVPAETIDAATGSTSQLATPRFLVVYRQPCCRQPPLSPSNPSHHRILSLIRFIYLLSALFVGETHVIQFALPIVSDVCYLNNNNQGNIIVCLCMCVCVCVGNLDLSQRWCKTFQHFYNIMSHFYVRSQLRLFTYIHESMNLPWWRFNRLTGPYHRFDGYWDINKIFNDIISIIYLWHTTVSLTRRWSFKDPPRCDLEIMIL